MRPLRNAARLSELSADRTAQLSTCICSWVARAPRQRLTSSNTTGTRQTGRRSDGAEEGRSRNRNGRFKDASSASRRSGIGFREVEGTLKQPAADLPVGEPVGLPLAE